MTADMTALMTRKNPAIRANGSHDRTLSRAYVCGAADGTDEVTLARSWLRGLLRSRSSGVLASMVSKREARHTQKARRHKGPLRTPSRVASTATAVAMVSPPMNETRGTTRICDASFGGKILVAAARGGHTDDQRRSSGGTAALRRNHQQELPGVWHVSCGAGAPEAHSAIEEIGEYVHVRLFA